MGGKRFRRRFVSGSLFVSLCPPECNFQSETKIEPDLRLLWRVVILPKMANLDGENDEFGQKTAGLLESGDFGKNNEFATNGQKIARGLVISRMLQILK